MKNRKYNYKTASKAWKRKNSSLQKKKSMLLKQEKSVGLIKREKSSPLNKFKNLNRRQSTWRIPGILFVSILITIILVIPTLIVFPYINDDEQIKVTNQEENPETVELSLGDSPFSVAVMRANSDNVENVPLETYVSRVVASEMPVEFELEALKAQALAARTFIVNRLLHKGGSDKSAVTDTVSDQVYSDEEELRKKWGSNFNENMNKIKEAVAATKGEILTYNDAPITPAYFSTSNGYTENSEDYWENELPYLRSVKSPWDEKISKYYLDQKVFPIEEVEKTLAIDLPNKISVKMSRTDSNRVSQLEVGGKTFTGREVRGKLELRSSDFTIEQKNDHLIFTTKGYGHGIGMSQYGANGMAKEGKNYKDIVTYYYQGVNISELTETAPTLVAK